MPNTQEMEEKLRKEFSKLDFRYAFDDKLGSEEDAARLMDKLTAFILKESQESYTKGYGEGVAESVRAHNETKI